MFHNPCAPYTTSNNFIDFIFYTRPYILSHVVPMYVFCQCPPPPPPPRGKEKILLNLYMASGMCLNIGIQEEGIHVDVNVKCYLCTLKKKNCRPLYKIGIHLIALLSIPMPRYMGRFILRWSSALDGQEFWEHFNPRQGYVRQWVVWRTR